MASILLNLLLTSLSCCYSSVFCSRHAARMIFTGEEAAMEVSTLPEPPQLILPQADTDIVTVIGRSTVTTHHFRTNRKMVGKSVSWEGCDGACYNISVAHERPTANAVVVCGSRSEETLCCELTLTEEVLRCRSSEKLKYINQNIREMVMKEGTHSILIESPDGDTLFATYSGIQENVGIHKLGYYTLGPTNHNKEQHFKGMMLSRHKEQPLHDKIYAFYNEKDTDEGETSKMWTPYVTQVCLADKGGKKNELQYIWTSQLSARLFCGDPEKKWNFFELVDVATIHAESWQDTRMYALFRNEWSVSAVCIYTVRDIDKVFKESVFRFTKNDRQPARPRECVADSRTHESRWLSMIAQTTEMESWVKPLKNSGPVFTIHHNYTRIDVDATTPHPVLFLSLHNGGLHKVVLLERRGFVIAEYRPFEQQADIVSITPHLMKLYVGARQQLAVLNRTTCRLYGDTCQQCVLARDPQCGWDGKHCTSQTWNSKQEVTSGNYSVCDANKGPNVVVRTTLLPVGARYFLQCQMQSRLAVYSWSHSGNLHPCTHMEHQCLHLIDSMSSDHQGAHQCVSVELGYERVVVEHRLILTDGSPGLSPGTLLWASLALLLLAS